MKKIIFIFFASSLIFVSCRKEETKESATKVPLNSVDIGKELFEGKGNCVSCHQLDVKVIGPSIKDVAKIYKQKKGNIVAFLKEEAEPIVDPSQYAVMKTNFAITEEMSDEELQSLEAYIYSSLK